MNAHVEAYLSITRGRANYKNSQDDIISLLIKKLNSTLQKNRINVVVIWSTHAKNEVITCNDNTKTIIWDTNYWTHCAYYYNNLMLLEQHVKNKTGLIEVQCDALWRDLLRVIIYKSDKYSDNAKLLLTKYYLSYGQRTYNDFITEDMASNLLIDLATAKAYAFLHELAHITSSDEIEYYFNILKNAFCGGVKETVYSEILNSNHTLDYKQRESFKQSLDDLARDIRNGSYESAKEIIADMRALQSMCSSFMMSYPDEIPSGFTKFRDGIALARSFSLRVWFIEKAIDEILNCKDSDTAQESFYGKTHIHKYMIRDRLSEVLQTYIFKDCFGKNCTNSFLLKYSASSKFQSQTVTAVDNAIAEHLGKIEILAKRELKKMPNHEYPIDDILSFLLYYPTEEDDNNKINNPQKEFGFSGLLF